MANQVNVATLNAKFVADTKELTGGIEDVGAATRNYKRIMRDTITPTEAYTQRLKELNALVKQGRLTQQQAAIAADKHRRRLGLVTKNTRQYSGAVQDLISRAGFGGIGAAAGGPIGAGLAAIATAAAAATVAMRSFLRSLARITEQVRAAETFGLMLRELQAIQAVGIEAGMTLQSTNMAWQRVTRRAAEAAKGTGEAVAAFKELNINAQQFIRLEPMQRAELLAARLAEVTNQADRLRISFKLFDSEGARLGVFLGREGPQALREAVDLMQRLGALSQTEQTIIARTQRHIDQIKQTLLIVVDRITVELVKGWGDLFGHINRIVKAVARLINFARPLIRWYVRFVLLFFPLLRIIIAIVRALGRVLWVFEKIGQAVKFAIGEELETIRLMIGDLIALGRRFIDWVIKPWVAAMKLLYRLHVRTWEIWKRMSPVVQALQAYRRWRAGDDPETALGGGAPAGQVQTTPTLLAGSREFFTRLAQMRAEAFNQEQSVQEQQLDSLRAIERNTAGDQAAFNPAPVN